MSSIFKKVFIGAFIFTTLSSSFAGFWESITPYRGPKRDVITLIVTGNYKHPLVIAQLLQDETKQPYLLLPAANGKGIFFNPPRERSEAALEISEVNLARFIRFLNPWAKVWAKSSGRDYNKVLKSKMLVSAAAAREVQRGRVAARVPEEDPKAKAFSATSEMAHKAQPDKLRRDGTNLFLFIIGS